MSKHKTKITSIVYITKSINTPKRNVRQARQIEDNPSSSENKVRRQGLKSITLDLPVELSYPLIDEFWDVFGDEASTERLNTCKNIDKYENMMGSFYAWLALFVSSVSYDKCKTVFRSITSAFYYSMNKNKKITLSCLFENMYNWIKIQLISRINSYV